MILLALALSYSTLIQQADRAREQNRLDEAIALYQKAARLRPQQGEPWWYLGMCHYERDQYPQAERAFARLVVLHPKQGAGWAMLGLSAFKNRKYKPALAALRKAHAFGVPKTNDMDKVARYHLVILLNRFGHFEMASGLLMTFVVENAVTPLVEQAAGLAALRLNFLPEETPTALREPVALAGQACILAWQKRTADAQALARQLLQRFPGQANAHYLLGYLYLLENNPRAIDEFQAELEQNPNHVQARLQIAYEYFRQGRAADGLPYAEQAVRLAPQDFTARNILGRIYLQLNRVSDAVRELELAVQYAPASPEAHFHLATAYNRSGRKQDAARHQSIFAKLSEARTKE